MYHEAVEALAHWALVSGLMLCVIVAFASAEVAWTRQANKYAKRKAEREAKEREPGNLAAADALIQTVIYEAAARTRENT